MLEAIIVAVLSTLVWVAVKVAGVGMPVGRYKVAKLRVSFQPFRFSVRTMLIVTTLVAAVLGLAVWLTR